MEIKICHRCKRPFLAAKGACAHCPDPYGYNPDSRANLGCLLVTIIPLFLMIIFWLFFFLGIFIR
ncbi:MAG TPA: hypothetical protein VK400_17845 [Pyrinomonadaceae bacterium]|nr:hypothetical protein [Pyrinomonadaceae bacterium]